MGKKGGREVERIEKTEKAKKTGKESIEFLKIMVQMLGMLCLCVALIRWGGEGSQAVKEGLSLCYDVIIPAMFPFFLLSNLVILLGLSHWIGLFFAPCMLPLFRLSGVCATALVLGFIGGYPVGTKTTLALYESGQCSKEEAQRLVLFSNNAGPSFLFGVIASGLYQNLWIGGFLYGIHILSAVIVGVVSAYGSLFFSWIGGNHKKCSQNKEETISKRKEKLKKGRTEQQAKIQAVPFLPVFLQSVTKAMESSLQVCAFILCFTVLLRLLELSGGLQLCATIFSLLLSPLDFPSALATPLTLGVFELASGVTAVTDGTLSQQLGLLSFFLGWGGFCVHAQSISFLADSDLKIAPYVCAKGVQGILSGILATVWSLSFTQAPLRAEIETMAWGNFAPSFAWLGGCFFTGVLLCALGYHLVLWVKGKVL